MGCSGQPLDESSEWVSVRWVHQHGEPAGVGTGTLPGVAGYYLPLNGRSGTLGVLGLRMHSHDALADPEKRDLLENMVAQLSQAYERMTLVRATHEAEVVLETERLRNSLLSSISHDVRTPVASIVGSTELLKDRAGKLDDAKRRQLVGSIYKEAVRLEQLVDNLLEMTRIEGGGLVPKPEWHVLEEIVGVVLNRQEPGLAARQVDTELTPHLVYVDAASLTTALGNLVENAIKYSREDTPLLIRGRLNGDRLTVSVLDRGVGIDPGETKHIFEKFYRGRNVGHVAGSGLGLAIVEAVARAHGGHAFARRRDDGTGSEVGLSIDQAQAPSPPELDAEESRAT